MRVKLLNHFSTVYSEFDNEDLILGYILRRIRRSFICILPRDRVKIEMSHYDSTRGRIIYRLRKKDLND